MSARTIINPPLTNELNGLFDGTGSIDTGSITVGKLANNGAVSINDASLTLTRNTSNGDNEFDIVVVNPTTGNFLNIYGSQSSVIGGTSNPILSVNDTGVDINGTLNATALGITNGTNTIALTTSTPGFLTVGGNVQCSGVGTPLLSLQSGSVSGSLTTNSAGQLLWNGVVIS